MARTRKGERISLRDMLLRWCDPVLVQAVRAAEAEFSEDQINAACPCSLGGAVPTVRDQADVDLAEIERIQQRFRHPWNSLVADLRSRIMANRIALAGVPTAAGHQQATERIPPSYVEAYDFGFATDRVTWYRGGWRAVTASLNTEAAYLDDEVNRPLPLKAALLTWCDELLVDRYETAGMGCRIADEVRRGHRDAEHERVYAGVSAFDLHPLEGAWRKRLEPARTELLTDFRARIARGEITLTGLQTEPVLMAERGVLSPAWAERMRFDWWRQSVRVEGALFVDVVGLAREAEPAARPKMSNQPSRRGRPSFPMEKMVTIAQERQGIRKSSRKREADALLAEFQRQHPSAMPPAVRTIEDHVAEIYAAAARNAGTLKPPK